jgi:hypothetical protein
MKKRPKRRRRHLLGHRYVFFFSRFIFILLTNVLGTILTIDNHEDNATTRTRTTDTAPAPMPMGYCS